MNSNLNYNFKNKNLLKVALTHRSYLNENKNEKIESNERLEFLGDAVLELIVSQYLFEKYPNLPEGKLTNFRSKLVQTKTLSLAAQRLKIGEKLKLSKGEKALGGDKNPSILADAYESLVGAIYQDGNFENASNFVKANLLLPAEKIFSNLIPKDYKSKLQEIIQQNGNPSPVYKVIKSFGPDHDKTFKITVLSNVFKKAYGIGKSKQIAEQNAAKNALLILKKLPQKEVLC